MPQTTETAEFDRPQTEVFDYLADMSNLSEWEPSFETSRRIDDGPVREGARWHIVASILGAEYPMQLTLTEYDRPHRVVFEGEGDGLRTTEDIRVESTADGTRVTYRSSYDSDNPDLVDAAGKPAYVLMGKAAMRGMRDTLGR